ncbi:MAG: phenylalanine--tRNA ligase subunit beta, partial [Chitinophagaceae bacterium]|nr:phenylalanine--tRNA ligase subunit beta [Chitinophagaceae bacterium]
AMSHMGCVKNICAFLSHESGKLVASKVPEIQVVSASTAQLISIRIEDETRCARYAGVCLKGIQVAPSPDWLQTKLKSIGLRPINNIVDITNFVLHECGQPLHAFDLAAIKGKQVIIKTATSGEKFMCLDEKERLLDAEDLMICNSEDAMCIAGIFGGLHSGVSETTTDIFLESAWFEPESIRKTSMRHGLRTDAASRFEKGADISQVMFALQRAASLMCEIAGAEISSAFIDIYPKPFEAKEIQVSYEKIRNLAGKEYTAEQIKKILLSLCFAIVKENEFGIKVKVPFAKPDITMQADIVEEVMRIDGLDNIPMDGGIRFTLPANSKAYHGDVKQQMAQQLVAKGFFELFTNSITNAAYYPEEKGLVSMMNSLSANLDVMRPSMLETGLEAISYNLNRRNKYLKFFEFGRVYHQYEKGFEESHQLAIYISGQYQLPNWNAKSKEADIYYVKGIVEGMLEAMKLAFDTEGNTTKVLFRNKAIGKIIQVESDLLKKFDIKQGVWFVELNWASIQTFYENYQPVFKEIPRFPLVQRDLALVLNKEILYKDVQVAVKQAKSKLLQEVKLFDVFESDKLGEGKKSYAINLSFYDAEKTLTDSEVEAEMILIIQSIEQKLGASIRGN